MSFLNRLFKQKAPETIEQKIANLSALDQVQLLTCLSSDNPEIFTCAVISRLEYSPALLKLATDPSSSPHIKATARKRIGEHLDAKTLDVATLDRDVADQTLLLQLCSYSASAGLALVEQMTDADTLLDTAQNGSTTQIRQAAAHKISDREALEQLAKQAKLKDKSVYKIVKTKLEVFKEEKAIEREMAEQVNLICGQAEQLTKRTIDDIFHARKAQIEKAWSEFAAHASEQAQKRYNAAMDLCGNKLGEIQQQIKAEEERLAAALHAKRDVLSVVESLQSLIAKLYSNPTTEQIEQEIEQAQARQQAVFADAQARGLEVTQEKRKAEQLIATLQALLTQVKEYGPLEKLVAELKESSQETGNDIKKRIQQLLAYSKSLADEQVPEIITASSEAIQQWSQQIKQQSEQLKDKMRATAELVRRGEWAVTNGHVGRARAILRDLEESLPSAGEIPSHLASKIEDFKISIGKLGDWHEFAVTPKKEALVEQMKALVSSQIPLPSLADKIHKLQDQWKELCRGGQNQDETLWQVFHTAAQQAYEPCKTYFETQAQEREQNAEKRKTLITQLGQYHDAYDWSAADWKEVEKTLRISREAWQSYWPVPRKDIKELQNQFDQIMDKLYGKLNTAFEHNRTLKQAVVEQAEKLLAQADTAAAIEAAKALQIQWQRIGQCKRKDDQALWKLFRAHCDAIFEKRSQENDAHREEREQAKIRAVGLLDQLEQCLALTGEEYFAARATIEQISADFKAIGELPKNDSKNLFDRYNKLMEDLQNKTQQERVALTQQQWRNAFSIANELRQLELLQADATLAPEAILTAQERIAAVVKWPGNTREIITTRAENLTNVNAETLSTAEQKLRILCIRSEIIKGINTPDEDKALRMRYQVELLQNDGIGQASASSKQDMQQLLEAWLAQPGGEDAVYAALLRRFSQAWGLSLS